MYQIDVPSAAPALPAPAAQGAPGFFTDGDPIAGAAGTIVPADWLNAIQGELLAILTGVGTPPSKTTRNQLAAAMPKISGNSAIFPSGLIINWGNGIHADNSGSAPVVFATPFKTGVLVSIASNEASGPPAAFHGTGNHALAGMTVYSSTASDVPATAGVAYRWLAIGL